MPISQNKHNSGPGRWHVVPAIATWILPGLGHILIGEKKRGLILLISILFIWLLGLLVGGVSIFNRELYSPWFFGQILLSPSIIIWQIQEFLVSSPPDILPGPQNIFQPAYGFPETQALFLTTLAGLLNVLAIIDVLYREPHEQARLAPPSSA
ncbi:DUF6677 family protein [Poriferisphaera sp. WC338]|uniref:DUF6677 family protein n=1 Tax=Poriferisphaera sp. WC338 TaxID=3425129 RepID=UPI003D81A9AC